MKSRKRRRQGLANAARLLAVNALVWLALLLLLETCGQLVALAWPAYDVLFLQPDRLAGWREVPDLTWTWSGHHWYAVDFSVRVHTNGAGYHDRPHALPKPRSVTRVAMLGDSFIEAVQVPLEKTATHLLERRLQAGEPAAPRGRHARAWETLNFGVSNYSLGQYLLTWRHYASRYVPDYVVAFVAKFIMGRTVQAAEVGAFRETRAKRLLVRPTFRLEGDAVVEEPARDYDEFVAAQQRLVRERFGGRRSRRRWTLTTWHYGATLWRGLRNAFAPSAGPGPAPEDDASLLAINLRVLLELARETRAAHARLVVLDASRYFGDDARWPAALRRFAAANGCGYVPVYERLLQANRNGIATRWSHDAHLNEAGNAIVADALYDWFRAEARRAPGSVEGR